MRILRALLWTRGGCFKRLIIYSMPLCDILSKYQLTSSSHILNSLPLWDELWVLGGWAVLVLFPYIVLLLSPLTPSVLVSDVSPLPLSFSVALTQFLPSHLLSPFSSRPGVWCGGVRISGGIMSAWLMLLSYYSYVKNFVTTFVCLVSYKRHFYGHIGLVVMCGKWYEHGTFTLFAFFPGCYKQHRHTYPCILVEFGVNGLKDFGASSEGCALPAHSQRIIKHGRQFKHMAGRKATF